MEQSSGQAVTMMFSGTEVAEQTERLESARYELDVLETEYGELKKKLLESMKGTLQPIEESIQKKREDIALLQNSIPDTVLKKDCIDEKGQQRQPKSIESPAHTVMLGSDMITQLKRVTIPVFSGKKAQYPGWRAAFDQCVDRAPVTAEYKLLQLKQYLAGEPLDLVQSYGHSANAYHLAKDKLEKKYGGKRRQIMTYLDAIDSFIPLQNGDPKRFDEFADLLDTTVANIIETGHNKELGNGMFYASLQKKLSEDMLVEYYRWLLDKQQEESVQSLRHWVLQEADLRIAAAEMVRGCNAVLSPQGSAKAFFGADSPDREERIQIDRVACEVCSERHTIQDCEDFCKMSVDKRWQVAKSLKLCYCCLKGKHIGRICTESERCGVEFCQKTHHRMLHCYQVNRQKAEKMGPCEAGQVVENLGIGLRTVPVVLKSGSSQVKINALLDDGSTKTYINSSIARELGLQGDRSNVRVGLLNDTVQNIDANRVEVGLGSVDGRVDSSINVFTVDRVTGDLGVTDWRQHAHRWNHLKDLKFPVMADSPHIDMLIGIDQADFHFSFRDVCGRSGEPIARLTPLGWTCVGQV